MLLQPPVDAHLSRERARRCADRKDSQLLNDEEQSTHSFESQNSQQWQQGTSGQRGTEALYVPETARGIPTSPRESRGKQSTSKDQAREIGGSAESKSGAALKSKNATPWSTHSL